MTADHNSDDKYPSYRKMAWIVYSLLTLALILVLVFFVARDTEEQFFYTIMPAAAAYVLRPTQRYMDRLILRFTGVAAPDKAD